MGMKVSIKERFSEMEVMARTFPCSFLLKRLEQHHKETFWHSLRVASLCSAISDALTMEPKVKEVLLRSALLHDIGKLMIDRRILNKQEQLTDQEWKTVKKHCEDGAEMIRNLQLDAAIDLDVIRYHHENLDGTGYTELKEDQLSMSVKIIRVADSFDAMTGPRTYRSALSVQQSFDELFRWSGIHFEPLVVKTLKGLYDKEGKNEFAKDNGSSEA